MATSSLPIAHCRDNGSEAHDLAEHLSAVSFLAARFAEIWGAANAARLAGQWHDLGKYSTAFQNRIRGETDAHIRVIHAYAGAQLALQSLPTPQAELLAMVIAGHHGGLPDWGSASTQTGLTAEYHLTRALATHPPAALLDTPPLPDLPSEVDAGLWTRMVASAVYDADFLDAERFFNQGKAERRSGWANLDDLLPRFEAGLAEKRAEAKASPCPVDGLRDEVLAACRRMAEQPQGLFSLTVPTGGGKTLSSLAFALAHARCHGLKRVIYAVPFTSIIEQNAEVFRKVLGDNAVLEHHSALDLTAKDERETNAARLASENWDAPVIVTTTVQLFESLFASRTSQLRKLHHLAGSVLVLDEAQALPPHVLLPVTAVLGQLPHFGVSVVLCTATQPALSAVFPDFRPVEIAPEPQRLFAGLKRVSPSFPAGAERRSWDDIAAEMSGLPQVLAIVNTRPDCRALFARLPEGSFLLSTYQCAAHRRLLLVEIKRRLTAGEPVRVASTSLVEAGVDFDFPTVLRAMTGLDSLAQAAGRCNRNNNLPTGHFVVFRPEEEKRWPALAQAVGATEEILKRFAADPFQPAAFTEYFRLLYWLKGNDALDSEQIMTLLRLPLANGKPRPGDRYKISFRTAAERFHMIEPDHRASVVVPYGTAGAAAIAALREHGPSRDRLRALQSFTVPVDPRFCASDAVEMVHGVAVLIREELYREDVGLDLEGAGSVKPPAGLSCT